MTESKTTGNQALGAMAALILAAVFAVGTAWAQSGHQETFPWMNTALTPDQRANLVLKELTLDEKIILIHGAGLARSAAPIPTRI